MVRLAMGYGLLALQVMFSTAACLAQVASPSQFASPSEPVRAEVGVIGNRPCETIVGGNQQLAPLAGLCEFALNYQQELPDFIAQMTIKERQPQFTSVVTAQIALNQGHESYSAVTVNGKPVDLDSARNMPPSSMRFTSSGEFGALLVDLFHPGNAEFQFRKQATLNGKRAVVYDFHVSASSHAFWMLTDDLGQTLRPELRGELWVDAGTGRLIRENFKTVHLPSGFEITAVATSIDYAETNVGEAGVFLLPSKSESSVCTRQPFSSHVSCVTNVKTFVNYRKFAATTRIMADVPEQ